MLAVLNHTYQKIINIDLLIWTSISDLVCFCLFSPVLLIMFFSKFAKWSHSLSVSACLCVIIIQLYYLRGEHYLSNKLMKREFVYSVHQCIYHHPGKHYSAQSRQKQQKTECVGGDGGTFYQYQNIILFDFCHSAVNFISRNSYLNLAFVSICSIYYCFIISNEVKITIISK